MTDKPDWKPFTRLCIGMLLLAAIGPVLQFISPATPPKRLRSIMRTPTTGMRKGQTRMQERMYSISTGIRGDIYFNPLVILNSA